MDMDCSIFQISYKTLLKYKGIAFRQLQISSKGCLFSTSYFTGMLVMNICKDTYQHLGLNGHPSKAGKNTGKFGEYLELKSWRY